MKMIARFTEYCVRRDIISSCDAEWFSYGLVYRWSKVITICILFPIGCWLSTFSTSFSFYVSFILLRKRTNGYHAKTFVGCFLFSLCCEFVLFLLISPRLSNISVLLVFIVSAIVIFFLAPYDHPNLHMTKEELAASGHLAKQNVLVLILAAVLTWKLGFLDLAQGIALGFGYTAFLLIVAYATKWKYRKEK